MECRYRNNHKKLGLTYITQSTAASSITKNLWDFFILLEYKIHKSDENGEWHYMGPYDTKANGTQYGRVSKMINGKEIIWYTHQINEFYHSYASNEPVHHNQLL